MMTVDFAPQNHVPHHEGTWKNRRHEVFPSDLIGHWAKDIDASFMTCHLRLRSLEEARSGIRYDKANIEATETKEQDDIFCILTSIFLWPPQSPDKVDLFSH